MNHRSLGLVMVVCGTILVIAGVLTVATGEDAGAIASPSVTTAGPSTVTTAVATTSTAPATTVISTTTTSTAPSTTSTVVASETVQEFVLAFADALEAGDMDFVLGRLHPDVVNGYSQDVCQDWVATEIMGLSEYELTDEPAGPVDKRVTIAGNTATIPNLQTAPVSFVFGGQSFEASADFALVDGLVYWLGACEQ